MARPRLKSVSESRSTAGWAAPVRTIVLSRRCAALACAVFGVTETCPVAGSLRGGEPRRGRGEQPFAGDACRIDASALENLGDRRFLARREGELGHPLPFRVAFVERAAGGEHQKVLG